MSLFNEFEGLLKRLKGDIQVEVIEAAWYMDDDDEENIHWNLDSNLEELYDGNGSSYSAEIIGTGFFQDDCYIVNVYDGCGGQHTIVFRAALEVDYDDLEIMYGDDDE